jgi:hypothetical protein
MECIILFISVSVVGMVLIPENIPLLKIKWHHLSLLDESLDLLQLLEKKY